MIPLKSVRTSWCETATSMENQIFKFYHIRLKKPWRWKQILGITRNTFPKAISQDFLDLFCFFLHSSGINPRGIPLLTGWIYNKLHLCFYTSSFLGGEKKCSGSNPTLGRQLCGRAVTLMIFASGEYRVLYAAHASNNWLPSHGKMCI